MATKYIFPRETVSKFTLNFLSEGDGNHSVNQNMEVRKRKNDKSKEHWFKAPWSGFVKC